MNHPFMDPHDAPWTPEYQEEKRRRDRIRQLLIEQEIADYEHGHTPRRPGR